MHTTKWSLTPSSCSCEQSWPPITRTSICFMHWNIWTCIYHVHTCLYYFRTGLHVYTFHIKNEHVWTMYMICMYYSIVHTRHIHGSDLYSSVYTRLHQLVQDARGISMDIPWISIKVNKSCISMDITLIYFAEISASKSSSNIFICENK